VKGTLEDQKKDLELLKEGLKEVRKDMKV